MLVWRFYMAPALKHWPLNLHLGACLKAYNSATKGATDMGPTVIESSWPEYSQQLGAVNQIWVC